MKGKFNTIKKSRKKSKDIDEKIEYLNKECQKNGLQEVMTTTGIYSVLGSEPNPSHNAFKSLSHDGQPLGFSGANFNINAEPLDGFKYSPPHPVTGVRQRASSWFGIASGFGPVAANSDRQILWIFDQSLSSGFGRFFSLELTGGSNPFWGTWISTAFGAEMLVPYNSGNSPLSNNIKNALNNLNINNFRNPDDFGSPTNPVLFKNDLGDPGFTPVDILSAEGYNRLKELAEEDLLALFGFGGGRGKPIYYGGQKGEDLRNLKKQMSDFDKMSPLGGGPGGVFKLSHVPEGDLLSEAVKLGYFDPEVLNVDIEDIRKGIVPEFPKDEPEMIGGYSAKSRLVRKDPKFPPYLKVTRKDLARNHNLTDKEIITYLNEIKMINAYIKKNPSALSYVMIRYPKNDPRLAQLNFKLDQMKRASDEYVKTHFPENVSLFNKLQNKIRQNIEMTDPKNFTGHVEAPKFIKTDISEQEKRRKTIIKHFKKKK